MILEIDANVDVFDKDVCISVMAELASVLGQSIEYDIILDR